MDKDYLFRGSLERLAKLEREMLLPTATEEGLIRMEQAVRLWPAASVSAEERRRMLLQWFAICDKDKTASGVERALDALGITATVTESDGAILVMVQDTARLANPTETEVKALAERVLPLHLTATYQFPASAG